MRALQNRFLQLQQTRFPRSHAVPLGALVCVCLLAIFMTACSLRPPASEPTLRWQQIPPLPDPVGLASAFAGVSGGALIVGGGANFPDKLPWEGGTKIWHDQVFVLERAEETWRSGFKLPVPGGYGISVNYKDEIICIGGSDSKKHLTNVYSLQWKRGELLTRNLPSLPLPIANACGALLGDFVYVAGGTETHESTTTLRKCFHLNLSRLNDGWEELEPWPGPARMLSVAAAVDGSFFLVGGTDLSPGPDGAPVRTYLKDAYRFTPQRGWKKISDLPHPVVAAPSPAPTVGDASFLVVGGDDGSLANFQPRSKHPGFPKTVLRYDVRDDAWRAAGETPAARVTVPVTRWNNWFVIPSGEMRPGVRSPKVWALQAD